MTAGEKFEDIQLSMNKLRNTLDIEEKEVTTLAEATLPILKEKIKPHIKPCGMCWYEAGRTDGDVMGVGCTA